MSAMPGVIRLSGPFGPVLVMLGSVVVFLSIRAAWAAARDIGDSPFRQRNQTNAVLFWGVASMVLGFLGQCHGVYMALNSILAASEISPQIVAEGFVISFIPTLFGLGILAFAFVVWVSLRYLPGKTPGAVASALAILLVSGCVSGTEEVPQDLADGLWTLDTGPNLFLWEFSAGLAGTYSCVVHDYLEGMKYTETPCASVDFASDSLALEMPNGVRYEGRVDLARRRIEGSLLYLDGSDREAPLEWAPLTDFPTLQPRLAVDGDLSYTVPEDRGDGLEAFPAAEKGVDPAALEKTLGAILRGEAGFLKSLLVLRGDALLLEEYFHGYGPDDLVPTHSVTKSVSSLLVGLAVQEGRIPGENISVLDFFPAHEAGTGEGWEELSLDHLLTMSMALDWTPDEAENVHGTGPEAFQRILARNVVGRPGQDWAYVNMNVNLLAGVLHQATGEHAEAFAARALFGPLGIRDWNWEYGKTEGFNLMDGSLRLRPRDMAKLGVLVLNGGVWAGRRILEEEWVRRSLTTRLPAGSPEFGYGYLWWTGELPSPDGSLIKVAFANGWGSQFILLFPDLDLVVVTTGGNQENGKHMAIGEVLIRDLLPGVKATPF